MQRAIGDRSNLVPNPDDSTDVYIQATAPGGVKDANWLRVTNAPFNLLMRMYSPKPEFLEGQWTPPLEQRVVGTGTTGRQ